MRKIISGDRFEQWLKARLEEYRHYSTWDGLLGLGHYLSPWFRFESLDDDGDGVDGGILVEYEDDTPDLDFADD